MDTSDFSIQNVGADQLAIPGAMRLPLVSFILTGRRGSDFGAAIEALRMQDYARFEVIVVDADATDASRGTLDQMTNGDPRFKRVGAPTDPGPFRLATLGLAAAEGEFVAFLEATDLPAPGFASAHIQAHLASRHNVAFTASMRHDDDVSQPGGSVSTAVDASAAWLPSKAAILRLSSLDDDRFAHLASCTALVEPSAMGWSASPEAIQVYRRFVIDLLHPPDETDLPSSADAHYAPLCQLLGGSAAIRIPLSKTLRAPGAAPADRSAGAAWSLAGDRQKLSVWAANGATFSHRIGAQRYWDTFAAMLGIRPGAATAPSPAEIADAMDGQFPRLAGAFGEKQAIHHLHALLSRPAVLAILRKHHGGRLPLRAHWAIRSAGLRQMHEGIRLYLRARRNRRR